MKMYDNVPQAITFLYVEMGNSLLLSRQSLNSKLDVQESPISVQLQNHQLSYFATLNSDVTPRSLDPAVPWEVRLHFLSTDCNVSYLLHSFKFLLGSCAKFS